MIWRRTAVGEPLAFNLKLMKIDSESQQRGSKRSYDHPNCPSASVIADVRRYGHAA
jgi:hypothetical protein